MAPNRITPGGATLTALLLVAALLAGCGGGGSSAEAGATATTDTHAAPERSADAALLDRVLARQEAAVGAYAEVIPALPPHLARTAAYFRAQEQEHVDAVLKAMRGLQSPAEPTPEQLEPGELKSDRERLEFLYEVESATIDEELSAISKLEAGWPRSLLASTVADQAQHLTLLRRALGAGVLASVPVPFEDGTFPPPVG
ncbi:MAG TPA: ferritin-like domain-containing protein [Solirubrobacterales bacterium]|nr:ferritin-like domain-containing protein [Solirubrobacterales bacterium]